jgi:hypothetical protein
VTFAFGIFSLVALLAVARRDTHYPRTVVLIDCGYIAALLAYRIAQEILERLVQD